MSLDVDNQWSYMKTHGDAGWEARPSYYPVFFDTTLRALDTLGMHITFFVVGRDAKSGPRPHHDQLRAVIAAGHEVGNHSFEHEPWLHRYTPEQLASEIGNAETAIESATGQRPVGFRGPGFSWSPTLFEVLVDRGYIYDAVRRLDAADVPWPRWPCQPTLLLDLATDALSTRGTRRALRLGERWFQASAAVPVVAAIQAGHAAQRDSRSPRSPW